VFRQKRASRDDASSKTSGCSPHIIAKPCKETLKTSFGLLDFSVQKQNKHLKNHPTDWQDSIALRILFILAYCAEGFWHRFGTCR